MFNYIRGVATLTVNSLSDSGVTFGSVLDIVPVARGADMSSFHCASALLSFGTISVRGAFCFFFAEDFWYAMLIALLSLIFSQVLKEYSVSMCLFYLLSLIKWLRKVYYVVLGELRQ